jgi:Transcriptional accessory protein
MNTNIINEISKNLLIKVNQIEATLKLLEDGNTIPFIARYRKEVTGNLDEEIIRSISEVYMYQVNLSKRKEDVIRLIDEKGMMTDDLMEKIMSSTKLVEVEDLYRPYKEKKKTKATEAIANGLEPLAREFLKYPVLGNIEEMAKLYVTDKVKTIEEAIQGAKYIIAENISDNAIYRKWIRNNTFEFGTIASKKKKSAIDEEKTYEMYYDYEEKIKFIKPHRVLAFNRGEKENVLSVSINYDTERVLDYIERKEIKNSSSIVLNIIKESIEDSYKRLIEPSIEREIRSELTEMAEVVAIDNFGKNLEKLLLQPPMKDKMVLALDPAYRTGCKLAVLDHTGQMLKIEVIYPHEPIKKYEEAKSIVKKLIIDYKIDIVAIGNGTASRESEAFIVEIIKELDKKVEYIIVSEAGASVYSASKLAIEEFPDLTVEKRSAISIGRRLQDPLSELVKIDPESIGVGLYQHDIANKKLSESLDYVVSSAVNKVGVNINTASPFLLKYVSGITKKNIEKLIEYRNSNGKIKSRLEIKKKKLLSDKIYEQAVGFLRIVDGDNELDITGIHPESYDITNNLLKKIGYSLKDIGDNKLNEELDNIDIKEYSDYLGTDVYTLEDIIKCLKNPTRDPRDEMPKPILKSDILHIEDLAIGMKLQGTVRNVIDFGAFIDIGLKNDALVHISKITNKYIKHPSEILSIGDIIDCYIDDINLEKKKVSLSLLDR